MTEERAKELFDKAMGKTKRNQKLIVMKQKYGYLVLRKMIQYNVTDGVRDEVAEIHTDKGVVISRARIILRFKK